MGTSYLESVNVTWSDTKLGRGPTGTAIRTGEYSIISNTQTDPDFKPWREKAMKNGFKSVVSLPLLDEGKAYGALTIYADSVNAFTLDEIKLLSEMTNNLSYGIISLRARLERDTAEQIIRENEQRLIDAQVMGRMGNWEYNVDTGETKWFEGMYELYNRDSSLGPPGREDNDRYYSREQQKLFVDFVQTAIENNKEITYDFEMTDENGHKKYCTASIRPVINEKREAYKIFGIVQDITKQRKAEEALSQSEEMLRLIIDSIPQGIIVTSLEGQLSRVNPSFLEFFGYDSEIEVIGKNALDFAVESDRERILDQVVMAREEKKQKTTEYTALKKDGSSFSAAVSVATLNDSTGKTTGFIGVIVDITERLKMQEQLIVTDRLASVGELAAGIAHELNNPLTGVVGFSDLLMGRDDIPLNIREDLNIINREALRASQVARHLLTFARRHPDEKTPVNVNSIITLVMELRSYEQRVNNIVSRLHLNRHIPDIMGNDFQLQQVFLNIIINAEYFMTEEHGKGILDITSDVVDDKVRITFKDDGPGISQENLTHIFNPFYTTKAVGKGTGLGLSICHGIITEHSGSLTAESEPGKGATFIIELPVYHRES
ncbi:MAG: PAS domain S-box protein [Dehalococcoidales bacterium]|nr:PAS domain S-box protein [Dehalococcoidales bacterium]